MRLAFYREHEAQSEALGRSLAFRLGLEMGLGGPSASRAYGAVRVPEPNGTREPVPRWFSRLIRLESLCVCASRPIP
jgi:hypothetical protein